VGEETLEVVHTPNPCDQHAMQVFPKDPFPFMWFYRTEVRNPTGTPLRVVALEAYLWKRGRGWVVRNVMGRPLNEEDFRRWYGDENGAPTQGAIAPGGSAVCPVNWHGGHNPWYCRVKWWYRAVDDEGKAYEAESEVVSKFILNWKTAWWVVLRLLAVAGVVWLFARGMR